MRHEREKKAIIAKNTLLKTVGKILKEESYSKLSINNVSEKSKISRTFIYRHFNDFEGLLKAYIEKQDYWLKNLDSAAAIPITDHREFMKAVTTNLFWDIYKNEELQQFLVWELGDKYGFTSKIAIEREILTEPMAAQLKDVLQRFRIDLNMVYAILVSSVYYLILHKDASTFCQYDFTNRDDVNEFIKTLHWLIDIVFDKLETEDKLETVAIKAHTKGMTAEDIADITGFTLNKVKLLIHKAEKGNKED